MTSKNKKDHSVDDNQLETSLIEIISSVDSETKFHKASVVDYLISLAKDGFLVMHQTKGNIAGIADQLLEKAGYLIKVEQPEELAKDTNKPELVMN